MKTNLKLRTLAYASAMVILLSFSPKVYGQDLISCTSCWITPNYSFNSSNNELTIVDMVIQNNGWYNATAFDFAVIIRNVNTGIEYEVDRVNYSGLNYQQDQNIVNYVVDLDFHPNVPSGQYRVQGRINDNQAAYETNYNNNIEYFGNTSFNYTAATGVQENNSAFTNLNLFPNPSNEQSSIRFSLEENAAVSLNIYDMTGKLVQLVSDKTEMTAGDYAIAIETTEIPSGVYFMTLTTGEVSITRRLTVAH